MTTEGRTLLALLVSVTFVTICHAQQPNASQRPAEADPPAAIERRLPRVSVGIGITTPFGEGGAASLLSVQLPLSAFVSFESETSYRSVELYDARDVFTTGGNVLLRAGRGRVAGFAGGGLGVYASDELAFVVQGVGGVDVSLLPKLIGFAAVRTGTGPEDGIRAIGGIRIPIGDRAIRTSRPESLTSRLEPASSHVGKEVRVTAVDGSRGTGSLVLLSDREVVFRQRRKYVSLPLENVRKVEKVSHGLRNGMLIGLAASAWPWIAVASTRDTCGDCEDGPVMAALMTPVFVGIGAGVGALVDAARSDGNVLYRRPTSRVVKAAPLLSSRRQGLALTMQW